MSRLYLFTFNLDKQFEVDLVYKLLVLSIQNEKSRDSRVEKWKKKMEDG